MPTNQSVTLVKGTIPPGLCFTDIPSLYSTFVDTTTAYVNGNYSLFNFGNSTPSADDNDKPWIRTVGGEPDRLYVYKNGYWLAKHPSPASGKERRIWTGTDVELVDYDGGSAATTPNEYQGPMWEVDTLLTAPQSSNTSYEADIYDTDTIAGFISNVANNKWMITQAHNLNELPDKVSVTVLCAADDSNLGYVAGDEIDVVGGYCNVEKSQGEVPYLRFHYDETQVTVMIAPQVQVGLGRFFLPSNKTDTVNSSHWERIGGAAGGEKYKFRIRVWKKGGKVIAAASTNFSYIKRTSRVYYTA